MPIVDEEPIESLWTGAIVLRAVVQHVRWLHATGHVIVVGDDTRVRITPAVPADTWYLADSNWRDVVAILEADEFTGFRPTHRLGISRMVH